MPIIGTANSDDLSGDINPADLRDRMLGLAGHDTLRGLEDADTLEGGDGFDNLHGGPGTDSILGGADPDDLIGGPGSDTLRGGDGDDFLLPGGGASGVVDGGLGRDNVAYDGEWWVVADLGGRYAFGLGGAGAFADALSGVEAIQTGRGGDKIVGSAAANFVFSGAGEDFVNGADGDDQILGGDHSDRLLGGVGADRLEGDSGSDFLDGGEGTDTLVGGLEGDRLRGGAGADVFHIDHGLVGGRLSRFDLSQPPLDLTTGNYDRILDFEGAGVPGGDVVRLNTDGEGRVALLVRSGDERIYGVFDAPVGGALLGFFAVESMDLRAGDWVFV
jgi:Ca2+-binding RTX toxin-like protein